MDKHIRLSFNKEIYIHVKIKFWYSHIIAALWMTLSISLSISWLEDLSKLITRPGAILLIAGIGYIPGYINAFVVSSLLLDKQPKYKNTNPIRDITIIIACRNEEGAISETLKYIAKQDYKGKIKIIIADNGSSDRTSMVAVKAAEEYKLDLISVYEKKPGKHNALNTALRYVTTEYLITLDADTLLHKAAIKNIVARIESSPKDVCAVAGTVLVRNSRENLICALQEWDYFLGIASIKRMQGLYQGTLVAQGAYSIYKTQVIEEVGGWPDAIGEDIVLTWRFLQKNKRVYFEPYAVAFTEVPASLKHLIRQRSRWARGMIEALKIVKPWEHPIPYVRCLTMINLIMPYLDFVYTFCWIPGLILAFFGKFWIVGVTTLFVIPLAMLQNYVLYSYEKRVFKSLNLRIRKNTGGFILYVLFYQMLMSPISVLGYLQELFKLRRIWK